MSIEKPQLVKQTFPVTGMTCAACASSVETVLAYTEGVRAATVNFAANTVLVEYSTLTTPESLQNALQSAGYDLILTTEDPNAALEEAREQRFAKVKKQTIGAGILALPIFILGMFFMNWIPGRWISLVLSIPVLFYFGKDFYLHAWLQAKRGKANMDTLVALSTGIAFIFSVFNTLYPEFWHSKGLHPHVYYEASTVIIVFISFGKLLEEKAKSGTSTALRKLMGLQPKTLWVRVEGVAKELPISDVQVGDEILIRPGDQIPVDGQVISGESYVDESRISGEPIPVRKQVGDKVFSGTINQRGSFDFRAEKVGASTLLSQIIQKVQEAQGSKAPVQKLVDNIAGIFVPVVLVIACVTFGIWMMVGGEDAFTHALLTSITVLVIACPCALGLATPTAIMVGMGKGAENQILIKDAESLEISHRVNAVVLDKTGTITEGRPTVRRIEWVERRLLEPGDGKQTQFPIAKLEEILLGLESKSEHPLGEAVAAYLKEKTVKAADLRGFESVTGKGLKGEIEETTYFVGNDKLLLENKIPLDPILVTKAAAWREQAQTVIWFADKNGPLAVLGIQDQIKPSSKSAIETLTRSGVEVYMLTGDNFQTATAVAQSVGIKEFQSDALPSDKADFVKALQAKGKIVAMVGDGINDSQALAQADVSIAMGHGSDIAMDIAKITLISSDLAKIPMAFRLSKLTVNGIRQNLFWAFIYNLIGIPIAAGILYPVNGFLLDPMIAGAAMAFSSVSVVLNSLRLKAKPI